MRFSHRLYRVLLRLYPAGFRERYGVPLQRDFADEYSDVRTRRDLARFWWRTLLDFARSMPVQAARELGQDSRHALRLWRRRPAHSFFAIAVLAIATGANTGVFSVVNAVLLRTLAFHEPDRLAMLQNFSAPRNEFHEWRQRSAYLTDAASYTTWDANVEGFERAGRLRLAETSWNFFPLLGTVPVRGRGFVADEDQPGRNAVAVIGHGVWQQIFGGDPRAVGSTIRVNGAVLTIVGVAPPGFDFPNRSDLWTPTTFDVQRIPKAGGVFFWSTLGRLRPGLTWHQARAAFEAEAGQRDPKRMQMDAMNRPALVPLQAQLAGPVRAASLTLMAGVALLLLLACANVANLMLARTAARSRELMIRAALGASRARLAQQLVTEALLLAIVASAAGLLVAQWTARVATAAQPAQLATQAYTILDWRVLTFSLAVAVATALIFGVGPALYASRTDALGSARRTTAPAQQTRTRAILIGAQVAVTIALLTGSFALGRAFLSLLRVDVGYDLRSIATLGISLAGTSRADTGSRWPYFAEVLERVRAVPGVVAASATESLPLNVDGFMAGRFNIDRSGEAPLSSVTFVAPGFFAAMGSRIIAGREFTEADLANAEPLAVVNEEFARLFGGPAAVLGRRATAERWPSMPIVGVVRSMRYAGPAYDPSPQIFRVSRTPQSLTIVARLEGPARERIGMIRDAAYSVDPKVPIFNVRAMDQWLETTLARPRFYATAVIFFGALGLLLAIIGVYGVVSYAVLQRMRELGIRLALGTTPARLRAMVLRQAATTIGLGALAGCALAAAFGRYLQSLVHGADAALAVTASVAVLVTLTVAAAAIWLATRRIVRLDVSDVLRAECAD